jgi:hypothetical protein
MPGHVFGRNLRDLRRLRPGPERRDWIPGPWRPGGSSKRRWPLEMFQLEKAGRSGTIARARRKLRNAELRRILRALGLVRLILLSGS